MSPSDMLRAARGLCYLGAGSHVPCRPVTLPQAHLGHGAAMPIVRGQAGLCLDGAQFLAAATAGDVAGVAGCTAGGRKALAA